jgi:SAM-dependent methyltransferase
MAGLKREQDAFGWALYDQFRGKETQEIIERDDGHVLAQGMAGYFAEYAAWPQFEREPLALAHGRVLDVGPGAGRAALYLQSRGLQVVGIDNSPRALKVCKARGVKHVKLLPFSRISRRLGLFDTVLMYGNNFGLFGSFARARRLLRRLQGMTTPDAIILGATRDPYRTTEPAHFAYHRRNRARGRMGGQIRLRIRYKAYATPWHDYLLVSKKEMAEILDGTGWRTARHFDSQGALYITAIEKSKGT